MVLDLLDNVSQYTKLNKRFDMAIDFLLRPDIKELSLNKYEIDGDRIFAMVYKGSGRKKEDALLEVHKKYIDIQLVLSGTDNMGWRSNAFCEHPTMEYDSERDVQLFSDQPNVWLQCHEGVFAIFFPEDAHMPTISDGELHKIIVKVAVD